MSRDKWSVPISDLVVDDELRQAANDAVESGWWSMGPRVARFEERFAELCGVPHAVAVGSGTAALHMALLATGCGPGSEVIVPSLNFGAAANVVVQTGATPVFCDVRGAHDLTLDPDDVHAAVSERTRAIVVMHYGGVPCDMLTIAPLARERGVALIEDAAHAPGARVGRDACGSLGDVGCFSFFANKNLPVGEGGMVVTHNDEIAGRLRLLRSHGMTTLTWDRHRGHAHSYDVLRPGFNYRLDELRAAIGLVQLERLAAANEARRRAAARYRELLRDVDGTTSRWCSCPKAPGTGSARRFAAAGCRPACTIHRSIASPRTRTSLAFATCRAPSSSRIES